ncbi:MAG TPA: HAD hydrolase family protein [Abditibacteriaceae bacterium]|jgi:3-deoxy-D-manno-octulosonate 8-phosphate phosphatase (KDO 8-P phosphatase)
MFAQTRSHEVNLISLIPTAPLATPPALSETIEQAQQRQAEADRWARIKLLALDVDGVLTDGSLTFDEDGRLLQTFNVRDGFGLVAARRSGIEVAWISGRPSKVAEQRFAELELHHCILACADKAVALRELLKQRGFTPDECCFVGDDYPDLPAYAVAGVSVAVADAHPDVLARADWTTKAAGGRGAVREVVEKILEAKGLMQKLLDRFTLIDAADEDKAPAENFQR